MSRWKGSSGNRCLGFLPRRCQCDDPEVRSLRRKQRRRKAKLTNALGINVLKNNPQIRRARTIMIRPVLYGLLVLFTAMPSVLAQSSQENKTVLVFYDGLKEFPRIEQMDRV